MQRASCDVVRCAAHPTHVGNTSRAQGPGRAPPVHPHARGEHGTCTWDATLDRGSSPRTWGTRGGSGQVALFNRFIPTHVGNTRLGIATPLGQPVRPHARGEHTVLMSKANSGNGSSPRTWGTLMRLPQPAHQCAVHPHARGEHSRHPVERGPVGGSSPRTWGTRSKGLSPSFAARFIPTHVGNTRRSRPACGHAPRFIPTHVGNTCLRAARAASRAVHPHARGEHGES